MADADVIGIVSSSDYEEEDVEEEFEVSDFSEFKPDDDQQSDSSSSDDEVNNEDNKKGVNKQKFIDADTGETGYQKVTRLLREGRDLSSLKLEDCKAYLRKHGLRVTGTKSVCIQRIKEHMKIMNEGGQKLYPRSSFMINCKGDVCTSDIVLFSQRVYERYDLASRGGAQNLIGRRTIAGRVVKESYGANKQQHTFTVEVLWSTGVKPLPPLHPLLIKGRNLYRMRISRQRWSNEGERANILAEKHKRGAEARSIRAAARARYGNNNKRANFEMSQGPLNVNKSKIAADSKARTSEQKTASTSSKMEINRQPPHTHTNSERSPRLSNANHNTSNSERRPRLSNTNHRHHTSYPERSNTTNPSSFNLTRMEDHIGRRDVRPSGSFDNLYLQRMGLPPRFHTSQLQRQGRFPYMKNMPTSNSGWPITGYDCNQPTMMPLEWQEHYSLPPFHRVPRPSKPYEHAYMGPHQSHPISLSQAYYGHSVIPDTRNDIRKPLDSLICSSPSCVSMCAKDCVAHSCYHCCKRRVRHCPRHRN